MLKIPRCALLLAATACTLVAHAGPVTKIETLGVLTTPTTLNHGNAFNDLNPSAAGIQIAPGGVAITLNAGDEFHDHYLFTTGPAVASFIALTIDLGNVLNIDGLTVGLYDATGLPTSVLGAASGLSTQVPVARSAVSPRSGPGEQQVIPALTLAAGSYMLDVQGRVTGVSGGSYSGVLNLAAVPEPATASLVLLAVLLAALPASPNTLRRRPQAALGVRMDHA